jgi:hypothetical protein
MTKSIHDLVAFQRALDLTEVVYKESLSFPKDERFLTEEALEKINRQIRRTGKALVGLIRWVQKMERSTARPRNRETPQPR